MARSDEPGFAAQPALRATMDQYVERRPDSPALRHLVACYYELRAPARDVRAIPIVPDAAVDLIWVDDGSAIDTFITTPAAGVVGLHSPGARRVLGVRLLPGAISRVTRIEAGLLGVHQAPLAAVGGKEVPGGAFAQSPSLDQFVAVVERWLTDAVRRARERPTPSGQALMHHCVPRLCGAGATVRSLAAETGFSERYIAATCHRYTGLSPSQLVQVGRFQRVLAHLAAGRPRTLAAVSQACGYYDQAHMNRSLKSLVHATAGDLASGDILTQTAGRFIPGTFHF